jgi:hypothetical protein
MDEAGFTASAAGMCVLVVISSMAVKLLQIVADRLLLHRFQAWRNR